MYDSIYDYKSVRDSSGILFFEIPENAGISKKDIADSPTLLGIESIEIPVGKHPKTKNSENKFRSFNIILLPFAFQNLP